MSEPPSPGERDEAHERLAAWLRGALGEADASLTVGALPAGVGHSSETMPIELHRADGSTTALIVRLVPTGPAVFPTYDLGVQVAALRAVAAHSEAPVPAVVAEDLEGLVLGRPLFVMERIAGEVPADRIPYTMTGWLHEAGPEVRARVWDSTLEAMARVHRGQWARADIAALDRSTHGPAGLGQLLRWWTGYAAWVGRDVPDATIDAATVWLRSHLPASAPESTLLWGDARLSNALYRDGTAVALLDWEMAAIGPAEVDVAWFHFFDDFFSEGLGMPRLEGIPPRADSLARYEDLLGRPLDDLRWYDVFAAWRHSAVMARLADIWTAQGVIPPGSDARHNNPASRMLAAMLDLPAPGPPGGPMG